ncbi:MAG: HAMP domain-containing sensor histidine kinase [Methylomonas sp.]|nr:HAMP domain-containing sensor histidine kinase [Methylomonas sp.]
MNALQFQYQQKTERLADAFRIFNELSENLTASYQGLQEQVAHLNQQLAAARSERLETLLEKEKLVSRLRQILAALPAAVIILDQRGRIVDFNAQATLLFEEPLLGQQWQDVTRQGLLPITGSPHEHRLRDGRVVSLCCNHLNNDAEQIILISDISELRSLQDELAQQKHLSAMGEMVASLAHQIRTPLATAMLYASQLARPELPDAKRLQFPDKILERLRYLERQVNDMLMFARQGYMAMQDFSLRAMLSSVSEAMENFTGVFSVENDVDDDVLLGNADALAGALSNLLNNAVEAGADCIGLAAKQRGLWLDIVVKDNGGGMTEACQGHIFEPFYTEKTHGTGLGLAVVDSVVKMHGGRIACVSMPGQGASFTVSLPVIRNSSNTSSASEPVAVEEG